MSCDAIDVLSRSAAPRVLVVGDLILDRYFSGRERPRCQEAPTPVMTFERREDRPGGAANVAIMLERLGADVTLAGVVGADSPASRMRRLLGRGGLRDQLVFTDRQRPTTVKRRFLCGGPAQGWRQVLRVDRESRAPLDPARESALLGAIATQMHSADIVLVSDYGKGVCTRRILRETIGLARAAGLRILVDPARGAGIARYRGASCLTPNRFEAQGATGLPIEGMGDAFSACDHIARRVGAEAVVVTLDRDGMALSLANGGYRSYPSVTSRVVDVTGAGDMAFAVIGLCLAAGADYETSVSLGNLAAGLEVEHLGVVPLDRADLVAAVAARASGTSSPGLPPATCSMAAPGCMAVGS